MTALDANQRTDEKQVALAAGGDRGALADLLTRHGRPLHRFFFMQFRDEDMAQDLVQEVFERVVRSHHRLPRDGGFRPWLWRIAINVARNARRRRIGTPGHVSIHESGWEERLDDHRPSPRGEAEQHQRAALLMAAVERLEPAQREVIHLKQFQNLACAEVARILGVSEGTVWSRTHRALANLQRMLGETLGPRGEVTT